MELSKVTTRFTSVRKTLAVSIVLAGLVVVKSLGQKILSDKLFSTLYHSLTHKRAMQIVDLKVNFGKGLSLHIYFSPQLPLGVSPLF